MTKTSYGWANIIMGVIFFSFFAFVLWLGLSGISFGDKGYTVINSIMVLIIGILGTFEGGRICWRGYNVIKSDTQV